jgi:PKHD-type hydroxylase
MSFRIFTLLSPDEVVRVRSALANADFEDGAATAKSLPKSIKNNLQYGRSADESSSDQRSEASQVVDAAMRRHAELANYTLAKHWVAPSFSRYDSGMYYADHVDSGLMRSGQAVVRTDFAMTLFLADPERYEGGALILRSEFGEEEIKLEAGQAVVYSCRWIHRVEPVTEGSRLVCITWIQSHIADEGLRSVANDLYKAIGMTKAENVHSEQVQLLNKAYHNLLRSAAQGL